MGMITPSLGPSPNPLPVGEGWVRALFSSVFPAKAGTQTLSLRQETAYWTLAFVGTQRRVDEYPHSQPSPPQGGKGLSLNRVIARRSAPKQPRGMSIPVRVSPLGCFAALAMTHEEDPLPRLRRYFPQRGKISGLLDLPPLGEAMRSVKGGLVCLTQQLADHGPHIGFHLWPGEGHGDVGA